MEERSKERTNMAKWKDKFKSARIRSTGTGFLSLFACFKIQFADTTTRRAE